MKQKTLIIAPPGARNKREAVFQRIVSFCPINDFSSVVYLSPNTPVIGTVKRQFFSFLKKTHNRSAYIPFQAFTIKQLALHFHETFNLSSTSKLQTPYSKPSVISSRMRTLLLSEILKDRNIGYASLLSDLYRKIRHYVPDKKLSQLKEDITQLIFEEKTRDRAIKAIDVLQMYERYLKEKNLIDTEDMLRDCIAIMQNTDTLSRGSNGGVIPLLPQYTLVIDGFFDPTPLELKVLHALLENADKAVIFADENTELMRYFLSRKEGMTVQKLERSMHRETAGYCAYNSIEEEVEGIARNIGKLIIEGVKPWEITVCFPSLTPYLPMLRRIFGKYRIPAHIGEHPLSATKPVALVEEILTCLENDYPRNEFLSILTSPCLPAINDAIKKRAVTFSYRAGIIKGKESWLSIEGVLKGINSDLPVNEKQRIAEFQKGIKPVIDALEDIKRAPDITTFIDAFESALDKLGFFDYLKNAATTLPGGYSGQISPAITNLFSELRQLTELFGTTFPAGDTGFYLRYLLRDLSVSDEHVDGVKILPYEYAVAIESNALFFGGVIEGSFPSRPGIDPVLPEKVKRDLGLPHLEYYLERQSDYFKRLLNVPALDPYISCPAADGDKIFLPSPFLDWEKKICPADINIFTEEDVLVREGSALNLNSGSSPETYFDAKANGILRSRINAMAKKYFRVTDIDYYRRCPFRFYLEKILGLEMGKPPRFEVEYRQWGNLAHKTMEHLFKDRDWELDDLEKRLFTALEKSLKDFPIGGFWADVTREIFRNLLPHLKKQESEIRSKGCFPWLTEKKIDAEIDGIRLRGKIDRVDKQQGAVDAVILLDYKTGDVDRKSLQLPLYARMWQEGHSEQVEQAGYYSLKEGGVTWYPSKKKSMEEFIQEALLETVSSIEHMKKGMFPAEPAGNECRNCGHGALCGKS